MLKFILVVLSGELGLTSSIMVSSSSTCVIVGSLLVTGYWAVFPTNARKSCQFSLYEKKICFGKHC